jgi:hypothetical protein
MFDPSIAPQWVIWILTSLLPGFNIMMIYDAMSGSMPDMAKRISLSQYKWKPWP